MRNLTIEFLGPAKIVLDGAIVSDIKTAKTTALLAYLALESNCPHRREALAGLLWPESPEKAARSSLRQAVANLRRSLDDAGAARTEPVDRQITACTRRRRPFRTA